MKNSVYICRNGHTNETAFKNYQSYQTMKPLFLFRCIAVAAMLISIASCEKDDPKKPINDEPEKQEEQNPQDGSYKNSSTQIAIINQDVYIGAVYEGASVNDLTLKAIEKAVDPIDISYTFPGSYFDTIEKPSYSSMIESLDAALASPTFSGKRLEHPGYDICNEFSSYSQLKLSFGADVDIAKIFNLDASANTEKIKAKTGLYARFVQENFSIVMDYPYEGNVFANDDDYEAVASKDPVYVNSITFGHMAIVAIESEASHESLTKAFKAAVSAVVNGAKIGEELNISTEDKEILENSTIRIYVADEAKTFSGLDKLYDHINNCGEFTAENPGRPIFFTANRVEDDSTFRTSF